MYKTIFGEFDGNSWEKLCQMCFKQKYEGEGYQEMLASPGDFGLEGFTATGKVFQCYCPQDNCEPRALYEKHRDKITVDLEKLLLYQDKIEQRLGAVQIKQWVLVTPEFSSNNLLKHCRDKEEEFRSKNCSLLHQDFSVLVQDMDYLHPFLQSCLGLVHSKLLITPAGVLAADVEVCRNGQSNLIDNALRKHTALLTGKPNLAQRVEQLTGITVKSFLDGENILARWQVGFPSAYERFKTVISRLEDEVVERCLYETQGSEARYAAVKELLIQEIQQVFPNLEITMVRSLAAHALADWILRCPLEFE